MNSITKFAVKYPVSVLMLTLAVCLLGTISYNKLGTDLFPDLKNPALYVEVKSGQRPPEEVEKLITTNIESTTARQEGVKSVYSITKVGYTKVTVEYGWDQDMDAAFWIYSEVSLLFLKMKPSKKSTLPVTMPTRHRS